MNRKRKPIDFAPENMVNKSGKTLAKSRVEKNQSDYPFQQLKITEQSGDVVDIYLSPDKTPEAYQRKLHELIHSSGMTEDEAKDYLSITPILLELFYDFDRGLFAVESEAVESCGIFNPYTGEEIHNENLT